MRPLCLRVDDSLLALQQVARFWRRKLDLKVIGITGSVGKSTTKELVAEVLSQRYTHIEKPGQSEQRDRTALDHAFFE